MSQSLEPMYTVETVAARYHVGPQTVRRWIKSKQLRAVKTIRLLLIPQSAIEEFEQAHTVNGILDSDVAQRDDDDDERTLPVASGE